MVRRLRVVFVVLIILYFIFNLLCSNKESGNRVLRVVGKCYSCEVEDRLYGGGLQSHFSYLCFEMVSRPCEPQRLFLVVQREDGLQGCISGRFNHCLNGEGSGVHVAGNLCAGVARGFACEMEGGGE